jgi:hypothetical protein
VSQRKRCAGGHGAREKQINELNNKIIPFRLKGEVVALRPIPYQNLKNKIAIGERKRKMTLRT